MAPRTTWTAVGQQDKGSKGGGRHRAEYGGSSKGQQDKGSKGGGYRETRGEEGALEGGGDDNRRRQGKGRKSGKGGSGPLRHEGSTSDEKEWVPRVQTSGGSGGGAAGDFGDHSAGCNSGGKGESGHGGDEGFSQLNSNSPNFLPQGGYNYEEGYHEGMEQFWGWQQQTAQVPPPPPPLWTKFFDTDGTPYYYNSKTGLSQWDIPPELDAPKPLVAEEKFGGDGSKMKEGTMGKSRGMGIRETEKVEPIKGGDNDEVNYGGGVGGPRGAVAANRGRRRGGKPDESSAKKKEVTEFGPPGCNLFVFHLPDDWADDDLHEYFAPHGTVVSAKVMKELGTGRSRGFGFISYEDRVSAATAIKKMQGYKVLGKRLKVEFKKGEHERNGEMDDMDFSQENDAENAPKKNYPDDERLIGYLRAISAKNVVQSLKESEGGIKPGEVTMPTDDGDPAEGL